MQPRTEAKRHTTEYGHSNLRLEVPVIEINASGLCPAINEESQSVLSGYDMQARILIAWDGKDFGILVESCSKCVVTHESPSYTRHCFGIVNIIEALVIWGKRKATEIPMW